MQVKYVSRQPWKYVWKVELSVIMFGSPSAVKVTKYVVSNMDMDEREVEYEAEQMVRDESESYREGSSGEVDEVVKITVVSVTIRTDI